MMQSVERQMLNRILVEMKEQFIKQMDILDELLKRVKKIEEEVKGY